MAARATAAPAAEAATTSAAAAYPLAGRPDQGAAGARLAELFAAHGAPLLGLCRVLLRDRAEAEDAVQQAFLAAYTALLNGGEPRHPAAWLATIARNECRRRIEQRMRAPLCAGAEPESRLPDPLAAAAANADLAALWRAIGDLPRRQRKALLLREFSGLSYGELAAALGVSEPTVESLLVRARRELRARLRPVSGTAASVTPLAAIRELLARAAGGLPHPAGSAFPGLASSAPIAAKLVAGVAVVAVAGGTLAAVERRPGETRPRAAPPRSLPVRASAGAAAPEPVRRVHLAPRSAAPRGVSVATAVRRGPPAAQPPPPWTALRRSMPAPVARSPVRPLPVVAAPLAQPPGAPARAAEPGATQSPPEAESSEAMPVAGDEGHAVTNEEERSTSSGPGDGEVADEEGPGSDSSGSGSSGSGSEGEGSPESAGEGSASTGEGPGSDGGDGGSARSGSGESAHVGGSGGGDGESGSSGSSGPGGQSD